MEKSFQDDTILARWLSGELTAEELRTLESHPDFEQYKRLVEGVDQLQLPAQDNTVTWDKLKAARQGTQTPTSLRRLLPRVIALAVAASVALAIGFYFLFPSDQPYMTGTGEQLTIAFPDGSSAELNAVSELRFSKDDWDEVRRVDLKGEAYFEVEKGAPFSVHTSAGTIQVLGTRFNVMVRENEFEVQCQEGSVEVLPENLVPYILKRGDRLSIRDTIIDLDSMVLGDLPGWIGGEKKLDEVALRMVFDELERQFGIQIEYQGRAKPYSGPLILTDLDKALSLVSRAMDLSYTFSRDSTVVRVTEIMNND